MRKISLTLVIVMVLMILATPNVSAVEVSTNISVEGELVKFTETTGYPFVDGNNRTLVPFRVTLEEFGADVSWDQETRVAKAEKNNITVEVPIDKPYILVNGVEVKNDTSGVIKGGRTYVPIRKVVEAFNYLVNWDSSTSTALIEDISNFEIKVKLGNNILDKVKDIVVINGVKYINLEEIAEELRMSIREEIKSGYITLMSKYSEIDIKIGDRNVEGSVLNNPPIEKDKKIYIPEELLNITELKDILKDELGLTTAGSNEFSLILIGEKDFDGNKELYQLVKNKISYIYDIRTFTLYAFMNYTGYDDENNNDGFSEVRELVRNDLENMNLDIKDANYFRRKNTSYSYYREALRKMGSAPDFEYIGNTSSIRSQIKDLNVHLKEFYEKANIEELYEKYKPYYEKELKKYKKVSVIAALTDTIEFLRLDIYNIDDFFIQVNLLDAYERGSGMGGTDEFLGKGIITGPSDEANTLNIVHEFLHGVINPILDKTGQIDKAEDYIRALAPIFAYEDMEEAQNDIDYLVKKGFAMTRKVFDTFLNDYEEFNGTLEEFIRKRF